MTDDVAALAPMCTGCSRPWWGLDRKCAPGHRGVMRCRTVGGPAAMDRLAGGPCGRGSRSSSRCRAGPGGDRPPLPLPRARHARASAGDLKRRARRLTARHQSWGACMTMMLVRPLTASGSDVSTGPEPPGVARWWPSPGSASRRGPERVQLRARVRPLATHDDPHGFRSPVVYGGHSQH
jgi:hypothetical protein